MSFHESKNIFWFFDVSEDLVLTPDFEHMFYSDINVLDIIF